MSDFVEGYRLSPQQRRLWTFSGRGACGADSFCVVRVEGPLDPARLASTLASVVERHEILRTWFHHLGGMSMPLQVIGRDGAPSIRETDLRGLDREEQEIEIERLVRTMRAHPFDLTQVPMLRVALARIAARRCLLLLSLPALCSDGTGLQILVQEIARCYEAVGSGVPLADEPVQYCDLAEWLNALLESADTKKGRDYWRQGVKSEWTTVRLPNARPSIDAAPVRFQEVGLTLSSALSSRVGEVAARFGARDSDFLLACWQVFLWRFTRDADFAVAIEYGGREREETQRALGPLARSLPLRAEVESGITFDEVIRRTARAVREMGRWQEFFSWEGLQARDREPQPFLPFAFCFREPFPPSTARGVAFDMRAGWSRDEPHRVRLSVIETGSAIRTELSFDADLFAPVEMRRFLEQLQALIDDAVREPGRVASELSILSRGERQALVFELNDTERAHEELCVHELFERQAGRRPEAIAVVFEEEQISFETLDLRANGLARHLRSLGVGPETPVALLVERGLEFIVGLLAVMKAGGAYVPFDPAQPMDRLAKLLDESRPVVTLTLGACADRLPPGEARVFRFDTDWELVESPGDEPHASEVTPANLMYGMFTSGSTGRPKAVGVEHRQLVNYLIGIEEALELRRDERFGLISTTAADLGNTALFPPLCLGGCLHLISSERAFDGDALAEYLDRQPLDCLKIVPSHLEALRGSPRGRRLAPRRQLVLGGEACRDELVDEVQKGSPGCVIFNHYGPTEAAVGVLAHKVRSGNHESGGRSIPLGRPIANTEIYLLDLHGNPVPAGIPGELHIGGASLARGYLGRPEWTAERFVPNPFADRSGARLYRTGDLCRFDAAGDVEFLGRDDHQIKLRGYRIEMGEIEAVLRSAPGVRQALVAPREDRPGDTRLTAYVVLENPVPASRPHRRLLSEMVIADLNEQTPEDLREFVKDKLPDYMQPSAYVLLEALPLTANGKVDRAALPSPEAAGSLRAASFTAPRTAAEQELARIWSEVLRVERVGVHDDFFALGGHSLLAMQLISRVRSTFGVELPLRELFESPTVAKLAEAIERHDRGAGEAAPIRPAPRDGELPLSFAQQRLWFLDQLVPDNPFYNLASAVRLSGPLDVDALQRTLNEVVRRHEVLRTTFTAVEGRAAQSILPSLQVLLPVADLGGLTSEARERELNRLATADAQRPFDLKRGPLLRASLIKLGDAHHVVLLAMHHIVSDGWSQGVLVRELAILYPAFAGGRPSPLPELPIQYADFALWQRQSLTGDFRERQLSYWREQLSELPVVQLPADRPRPAMQSFRGARYLFGIPEPVAGALRALSASEGATLFMTLLGAFQVLLSRYCGLEDIPVGSPIAGRTRSETEGLIGFFVNSLVLRTNLSGDPSFRELVGRVREVALEAYAHQDLPFEMLVEELDPARDPSRDPLFQVMFALQNAPMPSVSTPHELTLEPLHVETLTTKFDMTVAMWEWMSRLQGVVEYSTDLLDRTTVIRMMGHLTVLLEGISASPDLRLSALPLLTREERLQLCEWRGRTTEYPAEACVHELFEERAEAEPDRVALVLGERQLTYGELNARANRLARHLRSLGVGLETPVGLCFERSLEMVVGILATLKAGGCYVPLDPGYPAERLAFMLEYTETRVVLTERALADTIPGPAQPLVRIEVDAARIEEPPDAIPSMGIASENLAYVMSTSGSTGHPKGVEIRHRGVIRLLFGTSYVRLNADERFLHLSPVSFDASTFELWGALLHGARCVLYPDRIPDAAELARLIREQDVSTLWLTASLFNTVIDEDPQALSPVAQLLVGGEALSLPHVRRALDRLPGQIINGYGPTENTTFTCCYRIPEALKESLASVPIGPPIANTEAYVLDREMRPVPIGVFGELLVGGDGLARGYTKRAELTAEKFVPHPFGEPGSRLYRTGDLVRWRVEGILEFIARVDRQVKLRGFRIELGEIEAALLEHPAVSRAVVHDRRDPHAAGRRLVAYVVASPDPDGRAVDAGGLSRYLRAKLPDYMIPAAFVFLESIPLTGSGKVDREALPAPERASLDGVSTYVEPRTPVEEQLAALWSEVLGIDRVGVHDNFFELGGDSILSIQVVARAHSRRLHLTPAQLFQHQTIAELAPLVESTRAVAAEQGPVSGPVRLTPIQHWFFEQELAEPHHFNQAMLLEVRERLDASVVRGAVDSILAQHDALRLRFHEGESGWSQHNAPYAPAEVRRVFSHVDLGSLSAEEQHGAIEAAVSRLQASLSLEAGPLLRVALFEVESGPSRLLMVIHHLAIDGVSWRILSQDLLASYGQLKQGRAAQLPPKTTSFKFWAERLDEYAQSQALEDEERFWRSLIGADSHPLPVDHDRGENEVASAETVIDWLSTEETRSLLRDAPKAYRARINDVLLTALVRAFSEWTREPSLVLWLEGHGREELFEDVDLSRTVGWFTTMFPLRLELRGVENLEDAVESVKEQLRRVPRNGIGYGLLRYLRGRGLSIRSDLSFNYLGQFGQDSMELSRYGLAAESVGPSMSPRGRRSHQLDFNCVVLGGRLRVLCRYSRNLNRRSTIENLTAGYMRALRDLIAHCQTHTTTRWTPSDFPLANLDQGKLDQVARILARVDEDGEGA
jgi:amino acid adenylation domain-containing protein/non-ribosomal peptide synthase protein (TIGR01720 family)